MPKYKRLYSQRPRVPSEGRLSHHVHRLHETDEDGNVTEIAAEYDPDSRGGDPADGRKVKGATIHWVDAATAVDAEVRLYDNLFTDADPDAADKDFLDCLNPGFSGGPDRTARWKRAWPLRRTAMPPVMKRAKRRPASSSCVWATSAWTTRTPGPDHPGVQPQRQPEGELQEVNRKRNPALSICSEPGFQSRSSGCFRL